MHLQARRWRRHNWQSGGTDEYKTMEWAIFKHIFWIETPFDELIRYDLVRMYDVTVGFKCIISYLLVRVRLNVQFLWDRQTEFLVCQPSFYCEIAFSFFPLVRCVVSYLFFLFILRFLLAQYEWIVILFSAAFVFVELTFKPSLLVNVLFYH